MKLNSLRDLYVEQLRDLYSAEAQLIDALPRMAEAATNPTLRDAYHEHLEVTQVQRQRLHRIFDDLGADPEGKICEAMRGLLREAGEASDRPGDSDVRDAALIAVSQRIEHFEIAAYGTVATYAETLGRNVDHDVLGQTLLEERDADRALTTVAETLFQPEALGT